MHFQVSQKGLYLNTIVDLSVPKTIKSDEKRLKQILFNLIGNATKFTFKGGITVNVNFGDGKLKVSIQDTGVGISSEDTNKLF
jgi:signal transduction histidine kinase